MTTKTKVIIAVSALATAFASGRYTAPVKIKTEIKTVEVEKKTEKVDTKVNRDRHLKKVVHEVTKPNGEKDVTTTITDDSDTTKDTNKAETDQKTETKDKTKEVTKESGHLSISLLGGASLSGLSPTTGPIVYGLHVEKSVVGPVNIGVWGLSNETLGASIGITF